MPLIEAAEVEMDEARRAARMRALMARLSEEAVAIWIASSTINLAVAAGLENVRWRSAGLVYEAVTFVR